jgi:hypothetical protein
MPFRHPERHEDAQRAFAVCAVPVVDDPGSLVVRPFSAALTVRRPDPLRIGSVDRRD